MKGDVLKCARCAEEFIAEWSDEEAESEMRSQFGAVPSSECETVCDDCYQEFQAWLKTQPPVRRVWAM